MASIYKIWVMSLIVAGAILGGVIPGVTTTKTAIACPLYCLQVEYMTCRSSGEEKLPPKCNCCLAPKNCTLHLSDSTSIHCNK
ncbi:serine-type endopeptidase inhibitor [Arabidopsis lyrata subsp. lyrata]|uniref:Serine-type endopeptidase inhibitor n=1 Tax=Arabidopsis lyrata subsp. lyrata TaxID=81972 RepID=D7KZ92_ARALL|nr:uncharacterized protein LOC9323474 [Arabidopsis lyrata subsp. lyrata]EFH63669.1 serine-type endopeptidase inhibitor [Arabidopsis lyrata subsp. lyrata]|eukprot:XP_002887410.1 uncharacterized protein LOC9323474 [Arabidopsis lyrata subsp. lyrata]